MNDNRYYEQALQFLHEIGIETIFREIPHEQSFLPGLLIENGKIIIDKENLLYPGDLLHEAAHLAVIPASERIEISGASIGKRKDAPAEEMMAIAWCYAACIHLDIDPHFVFHEKGYKGEGENIITNFREGRYFGVPVLEWLGMTKTKKEKDQPIYPAMIKWLRD